MFGFTKRPLFLIAWKNLRTYPVRIFLTTSSIILGVAVIIASNIFSESNKSAFDNLFTGIYEGVDLVVQPIQEDFAQGFSGDGGQGPVSFEVKKIPDEKIQEIQNLPSVKAAWGEVLGYAQYIKFGPRKECHSLVKECPRETILVQNGFAPTFGAAWDNNPYAAQWSLVEGKPPTNIREVVMDVLTAENHGFVVGDQVTVLAGATPATFTITGIAEFANVGSPGGATFALFDFSTAQKLLDSRGKVDLINVVVENNYDVDEVKNQIANLDSENLNVINAQEAAAEQADSIKQGLDFFNTILNVFAGIAIFVGAFIIQNTFRILLLQRTKELSLLRALGTSKRQIYRLVISESLFMSVVGSNLGCKYFLSYSHPNQLTKDFISCSLKVHGPGCLFLGINHISYAYLPNGGMIPIKKSSSNKIYFLCKFFIKFKRKLLFLNKSISFFITGGMNGYP